MMARYTFSLPLLLIAASAHAQVQNADLDINDVKMKVHSNGLIGTSPSLPGTYHVLIPADGNVSPLYSAGLWIGGVDGNGQVRAAAHLYDAERDLHPGPLTVTGGASITPGVSAQFNKVWKVNAADVLLHAEYVQCLNDPGCNEALLFPGYVIPDDFISYPAMGDVGAEQALYLGPHRDADANGIYEPINGDHPCLPGDQALFLIFNDNTTTHQLSGGLPMGVEVHMTTFAYASDDQAIDQTVFLHYKLINRSSEVYNNVYIGHFMDMDIGCPNDDFIGADVGRSLLFTYNWDDIDEDCFAAPGYGVRPPAFGVTVLKGPLVDGVADNADPAVLPAYNGTGFGDGVQGNERHGLSGSIHFGREGNAATTDPLSDLHYYNYLRSLWKDGLPLTLGGYGYSSDPDTVPTLYSYAGASDLTGVGTGGVPQPSWMETAPTPTMPDRRGVANMGPFTMNPGDEQDILLAYVYARASIGGAYASVQALKLRVDSVKAFAQTIPGIMTEGTPCDGLALSIADPRHMAVPVRIRPNPATHRVEITVPDVTKGQIRIFDTQGVLVEHFRISAALMQVDVAHLPAGLYQVQVDDGRNVRNGRFVKE